MASVAEFQEAFGAMLADAGACAEATLRRALSVHRNTSAKAAQDALAANFPVIARLVGPDAFHGCARGFVEHRPPRDPRLCVYGAGFASHVAMWSSFADYPYLGPVAALEFLVLEALFAADADPLDAGIFAAGVDLDRPLTLHPATRIASFDCPAVSVWRAHQTDREDDLTSIGWQPEIALITRPRLSLEMRTVDDATHAFLTAPILGDAAAAAHDRGGDVAAIFSGLLISGAFA